MQPVVPIRFAVRIAGPVALLLSLAGSALQAQGGPARESRVHEILLQRGEEAHIFRFVPVRVVARPGDVLLFRVIDGGPHSVAFERSGMDAQTIAAWTAALPRRTATLTSPVLVEPGTEYAVPVPAVPPGIYRFYSLPRLAYDMRAEVEVRR